MTNQSIMKSNKDKVKSLQTMALLPELDINKNWNKLVLSTHNVSKLKEMIKFVKWREDLCLK